ncbi:hypothetical protein TNCV_2945401 [Trichonephila clavipes]|nr:hypothetical protein TNCV_2945401 [Trichonephila clavipes]
MLLSSSLRGNVAKLIMFEDSSKLIEKELYLLRSIRQHTRETGEGPRNFDSRWSSDENDTTACPPLRPTYHTNGRTLSLDRFKVHRSVLRGGSSVAPGHKLMT